MRKAFERRRSRSGIAAGGRPVLTARRYATPWALRRGQRGRPPPSITKPQLRKVDRHATPPPVAPARTLLATLRDVRWRPTRKRRQVRGAARQGGPLTVRVLVRPGPGGRYGGDGAQGRASAGSPGSDRWGRRCGRSPCQVRCTGRHRPPTCTVHRPSPWPGRAGPSSRLAGGPCATRWDPQTTTSATSLGVHERWPAIEAALGQQASQRQVPSSRDQGCASRSRSGTPTV